MMDTKILKALQEINLEMRDELAAATADFIKRRYELPTSTGKTVQQQWKYSVR